MTSDDSLLVRRTAITVAALVVLRLIAGAVTPLTFDEAYYWTWSKHLAGGYYDHPPMVAVVIRLGTMIAGHTEIGVRLVSILLALPATWAVYRTARIFFDDARIASSAAILLNATLMVSVGTIIVTPDAPLLVSASFVLYCLAKAWQTGRGIWWIGVGVAVGCGLLSKYTAFFFGAQILLWLLIVKDLRRWFASPWPYLGGLVAFAVFSPVILWNADHQWVSFIKQLGRARVDGLSLKYLGELLPAQFAFATPSVFILGVLGLVAIARRKVAAAAGPALISISIWTLLLYFTWHSLHSRVEANWLGPVYPAFAMAAAVAAWDTQWSARTQRLAVASRRWALPIGAALFVVLVVQANTGLFTGFRRDATMRSVGAGWPQLARDIEAIRIRQKADCVLTGDYGTTSWLMFYLPQGTCVAQRWQHYRWTFAPEPDAALLKSRVLFVDNPGAETVFRGVYARGEKIADLTRRRSGVVVEDYEVDLLEDASGDPLDRSPAPELAR